MADERSPRRRASVSNSVRVIRGEVVESEHRVHAAVVDGEGDLVASVGDPERLTYFRSSAKPFQAMPLVEDGVAGAYGLTDQELAVCCASHNGEERHVALVRGILTKGGLTEAALECGPHAPFHAPSVIALRERGEEPGRIHNNCSGKHAGMLLFAVHRSWSPDAYVRPDHPVQRRMLAEIARWTGLEERRIETGVDGCGVVCFAVSVTAMANAYANLAREAAAGGAAERIVSAMTGHPFEVAGTGRLCTMLMTAAGGDVLAKLGAEGVYGAAWLSKGWGIGMKIEDGNRRALEVALVELLRQLGGLADRSLETLTDFARPAVLNTRNEVVGAVQPSFALDWH